MDSLSKWFAEHLGAFLAPELVIFVISMMPLLELRGGLIVAKLLGIDLVPAIIICILGNIVPIPFILLFIKQIFNWMRPTKLFGKLIIKLETKALSRSDKIKKGEFWGLVLFVGIPLPGTGAWTGALIASLLGIDIKKSSLAILLGISIATVIMSFLMYGVFGTIFG